METGDHVWKGFFALHFLKNQYSIILLLFFAKLQLLKCTEPEELISIEDQI